MNSPKLGVWLPPRLESFSKTEYALKKYVFRAFFLLLLSKVLICIRLSRVMTFNVINVTSIIPLDLSCLHLQNVNVSGYMAITRDPKERQKRNTGLRLWVGQLARSLVIHCHKFGNKFTLCQKYDTHIYACT